MIETERLRLRRWRATDLAPFAAMNADPAVTEFLLAPLTRAESDAFVARVEAHFDRHGFGLWAVEVKDSEPLMGFVGLARVAFDAPFTPAVEVGWRLARSAWGHGFASEAARGAIAFGLGETSLEEIVSFTVPANTRSRAVMERIGLTRDPAGDFDHPHVPVNHRLRRHVLYRIDRARWEADQITRSSESSTIIAPNSPSS